MVEVYRIKNYEASMKDFVPIYLVDILYRSLRWWHYRRYRQNTHYFTANDEKDLVVNEPLINLEGKGGQIDKGTTYLRTPEDDREVKNNDNKESDNEPKFSPTVVRKQEKVEKGRHQ